MLFDMKGRRRMNWIEAALHSKTQGPLRRRKKFIIPCGACCIGFDKRPARNIYAMKPQSALNTLPSDSQSRSSIGRYGRYGKLNGRTFYSFGHVPFCPNTVCSFICPCLCTLLTVREPLISAFTKICVDLLLLERTLHCFL